MILHFNEGSYPRFKHRPKPIGKIARAEALSEEARKTLRDLPQLHFFSIPVEIRNQIYGHMLDHENIHNHANDLGSPLSWYSFDDLEAPVDEGVTYLEQFQCTEQSKTLKILLAKEPRFREELSLVAETYSWDVTHVWSNWNRPRNVLISYPDFAKYKLYDFLAQHGRKLDLPEDQDVTFTLHYPGRVLGTSWIGVPTACSRVSATRILGNAEEVIKRGYETVTGTLRRTRRKREEFALGRPVCFTVRFDKSQIIERNSGMNRMHILAYQWQMSKV